MCQRWKDRSCRFVDLLDLNGGEHRLRERMLITVIALHGCSMAHTHVQIFEIPVQVLDLIYLLARDLVRVGSRSLLGTSPYALA